MNTRKLLVATLGLTAMLGGLSTAAFADASRNAPAAAIAPTKMEGRAEAGAPEARIIKAKVSHKRRAERRLVVRRNFHASKLAQARTLHKEARTAPRAG